MMFRKNFSFAKIAYEKAKCSAKFGFLYRVGYMVVGELEREIVVSTTRPETIFGDRAIGVHPDDPRYAVSFNLR